MTATMNEREILAVQESSGVDRDTATLMLIERRAIERQAELEAGRLAAGRVVSDPEWESVGSLISRRMSFPRFSETAQPDERGGTVDAPAVCPHCNGGGFTKLAVKFGDPRFGKLFPCQCKLAEREAKDAAILADLDEQLHRYRACTLANYDLKRPIKGVLEWNGQAISEKDQRKALIEAHRIASEYAANPRGWLYLYGPPGSGKTRLAASIANELKAQKLRATYGPIQALFDYIKAGFDDNSSQRRFEALQRAPLLLIDDIGTEYETEWTRPLLQNLINERYNRELPTILTSNDWRDDLPLRIADRIAGMAQVVWLTVGSHRRVQKDVTR